MFFGIYEEDIDKQPIAPGATYNIQKNITIPGGSDQYLGSKYLVFVADYSDDQGETNEGNNAYVYLTPIEFKAPDLTITTNPNVPLPSTAIPGQQIPVSWSVTNQGNGTALADYWYDGIYLSSDRDFQSWLDTPLGGETINNQTPLAADASYTIKDKVITIPTTAKGPQYLLFVADRSGSWSYPRQQETNELNNVYAVPIQINTPDLLMESASIAGNKSTVIIGEQISVSWTVKNQGGYPSEANWVDRIYISSDKSWDDSDAYVYSVFIDEQTPLVANNGTYSIDNKVITIPTTMTGERYLLFITDATGNPRDQIGNQSESDETNNTYAVPIEIKAPDLTVKEAGRPNPGTTTWTASWGQEIPVFWTVENTSDAAAPANWYDRVYISSDTTLNGGTLLYSEFISEQTPLAANGTYTINNKLITIPNYSNYIRGNQYLLFVTDASGDQGETNEAKGLLEINNVKPVPIFIAAPDLVVESVTAVPSTSAQFGQTIDVTYFVSNAGDPGSSIVASRWTDGIWLSKGSTLDSPRIELTPISVERDTPLNSGTSYSKTVTVPLPLNPQFSNGTYYIWVATDTSHNQVEFNETNNTKFSQPINLTLPTIPDLQVTSVVTPLEGLSGQKLEIVWTIYNGGDKDATGVWHDNVYLSKDGSIGNDDFYASFSFEGTIQAGKPIERRQFIDLPIDLEGERWVVVKTDASGDVYEHGQESNNTLISSNPMNIRLSDFPNLKVSSVTARTDSAFSGQKITVDWVVENTGTGSTSAPIWYDAVFLSLNGQETYLGQTSNFSYLDKYSSGIHSYNNSLEVTLPNNVEGNNYYLVVKTDYYNNVYEYQNEDDNFRSTESPTNIELTPPPDLQLTVNEHSPVFSGQRTTLNWTVVNNGPGKTSQHSWYDEVYMSADPYLGNDDEEYFLGWSYHYGELDVYAANSTNGATSSYTTSLDVTLPIGVSGNFYFIVRTDAGNQVLEFAGDANNIVAQPTPTTVKLTPPPDLEVELLGVPTQALASHGLTIDYRVTNNGSTATPNYAWVDAFYLSEDADFNSSTDRLLGEVTQYGSLDAGIPDDRSVTFTLPDGLSGAFHVFVVTDQRNDVFELNNHNNVNKYNNVGNNVGVVTVSSRPADLVVSAIDVPTTLEAGIASRIKWTVANTGTGDTAVRAWTDSIIASGDTNLGNDDDVVLGSFYHSDTLSLIDGTYRSGLLNPGDFSERNELVTIPFTLSGQYHLFVVTDTNSQVYEANALGNNYKSQLITVNRDTPDLQVTGVSVINATPSVSTTDKLAVNWTVKNLGTGRTNAYSWYDSVYLSTDTQLNSQQDIYLGQVFHSGALDQFGSYDGSGTFNLPIDLKGNYHVIVRTDKSANSEYNDRVLEGSLENNNDKATTNTTAITLGKVPNLVVESVDAPIDAISSQLFSLTWTVRNDGAATGYKRWYDAIYLSRDQNFDRNSDVYLDYRYHFGDLATGKTYTQQNQLFKIPSGLSGLFYVFVVTDGGNEVYERGGEGNTVGNNLNYDRNSVQVSLPNPTDLSVGTITVPVNAVPGLDATISYRINNTGPNAAQGIWHDSIYLSADDKWDINDTFFGRSQAPVNYVASPGNEYSYYDNSITAPLPGVVRGDYHVIVKSDIRNAIVENDENNNIGGSLEKVSIDVESLQLGVSKTGTLFQKQSAYYKIDVAQGETLQVTFDSLADNAFNELYIRYGEVPSQTEFDYGFENVSADQQIVVPFTEAGTYYVLARAIKAPEWIPRLVVDENTTVSGMGNNYTIEAKTIDFGITSIGQTVGDRGGKITLEIDGAKFTPYMRAELIDSTGKSIVAENIWFEGSTDVFATFDLTNAAIGTYDLKVSQTLSELVYQENADGELEPVFITNADGELEPVYVTEENMDVLDDAFSVVNARPDNVLISVTSTSAISPGQSFDIIVSYANSGTHDVAAPVIVVNTDRDVHLQNIQDGDGFVQIGSMTLLGISNEGPAGTLRPGEMGIIRLRGTAPSTTGPINITARQIVDDGTPVDYSDFIEYLGGDISTKSWFDAAKALQNQFGSSWTTFQAGLANQATESTITSSSYTHSATKLWSDVALNAWLLAELENLSTTNESSSLTDSDGSSTSARNTSSLSGDSSSQTEEEIQNEVSLGLTGSVYHVDVSSENNPDPKKPPTPPSNNPSESPGNPGNFENPNNSFDPGHSTTNVVVSRDPNDILGPQGFGAEHWVTSDPLNYTIRFENDPIFATAPAQVVRITQQLDSDLDFRTFRVGDFGFGDTFIDVPDNRAFYQTRLDLTTTKGIYVDVVAGIDVATGQAFWELTSIDPTTGVEPTNPLQGFLPPNITKPEGDGFVSYSVKPKSSVENGTVIDAQARIIFDINEPIDTPAIFNTIDKSKPTSTVSALPSATNDTTFSVSWSGSDNTGGSALAGFTIYVKDNGGAFAPWLENTTLTEATFTGIAGHTYAFYSRARDNAGNTEDAPKSPQASTTIAGGNPGTLAFGAGEFSISEDGTQIHALTIIRTDGTAGSISATVTLSDDTAISPTDYNSTPIVVTFASGETSKTVLIPIVNDTLIESAQKLNLVLGNPTGGATIGGQNSATVTIVDDDVQLAFSAATFSAIEDGTQEAAVTVIRTGRSSGAVSATITLSNGTATSPTDYDSTSIVVNFADGETTKTVVIPIVNDTVSESDEAIDLTLSSPTLGATIGTQSTATFIIKDNDTPLNLIGTPNNDTLVGGYGNDTLDGREGSDTLIGGAGNDTLIGGTGNDTLDGGIGNDSMDGGSGNDTYIVDSVADTVIENAGGGADTVQASVDFSIDGMSIENLILTGNAISGTGNNLSNRITGNAQNNILNGGDGYGEDTLDGGEGNDIMSGGYGHDTYIVDSPNDIIIEDADVFGIDTVEVSVDYSIAGFANVENLILIGNAINGTGNSVGNYLDGNALNNILSGGEGNDSLYGEEGDDTLIGGVGNDYLYGYTGNDTLDGGTGDDRMSGGSGNDTYIVDSVNDTITENINEGYDTVKVSFDYSIAGLTNIENLTLTGNAISGTGNNQNNRITGNDLDNVLSGGAGYDTLIGGAGNDTLIGGTSDDTYVVDSLNDIIVENANEGYDSIEAAIDYSIAGLANIERLRLTGNAINGTGNSLNNRIFGNSLDNTLIGDAGDDFLDGSMGNDTLIGGVGSDYYIIDSPNDTIVENALEGASDWVEASVDFSIANFTNVKYLTLMGNAINGTGNSQNNSLEGNALDNVLDGGEGDDIIAGHFGNDTVIGGDGNDTLYGDEGSDTLIGGNGNDSYYVDSTADTIIEELNAGTDSVGSFVNWTLGENLENLTLYGSNSINGTGNQLSNTITGNAANNILRGGLSYDRLYGEAGDDTLDGGDGSDSLNGGDGNDTLDGGSDHDYLYGNAGNDTLNGGSGNDYLRGDAGNDTLNGGSGNDSLDGSTGNDVLAGDDGDDYYSVDSTSDSVLEAANAGTDTVSSSVSWTLGDHLENLTLTGYSALAGTGNALNNTIRSNNYGNNLFGNGGNDTLIGGTGNDTLDGGTGNDRMEGSTGDDTYIVDSITDTIIESAVSGTDTVIASIDFSIAGLANIENLTLTGSAIGSTGNSLNNRMTGNALDNTLNGDSGNDTLIGDAGNDTLIGGTGNDTIDGGTGNDTMDGGSGDDTYVVDNTTDTIIENASSGTDTVIASIDYSIAGLLNIENLTLAGNATSATGNSLNNVITGNALDNTLNGGVGSDTLIGATGNDILDGGTGNDRMEGGIGDDTYIVDNTIDTIVENASSGLDTVEASVSFSIAGFTYVENLTLTGSATSATGNSLNNVITGNALNNTLNGGGGDDILIGGAGSDTLIGGLGNDTYIINSLNDTITEYSSEGTDTVEAAIDFSIAGLTYVENLTLTGNATNGTGNSLYNRMTGNAQNNTLNGGGGDDILIGGAGNDTLIGGIGNDTYIIDSLTDTITENASEGTDTVEATIDFSIAALTNIEDLTLTGNAISGTGNSVGNRIVGNAQNNILNGGTGSDTMEGGIGDDTYIVDTTSDLITENTSSGTDTIEASVSFSIAGLANVENLTLTGSAISGTGNSLNNVINGNAQNNTLNGGAGNDTLNGGAGNDTLDGSTGNDVLSGGDGDDTYTVDSASDSITEATNAGTDTVNSSISWTLGDNLENLTLTGNSTIDGIGNALNNTITANSVSNNLFGHDGNDNLTGGVGNDLLDGGTGDDTLIGGSGNDTLIGGFGNDVLTGSTGVDIFVLNNPNTGVDSITDLSVVDDTLRVSAAGFGGGLTVGAAITSSQFLIGNGAVAATNSSQRFIYNTTTGTLFFDADGNQTAFGAVQVATLSNKPTIGTSDIFVTT
ncbi:hypothetical protein F7734_52020 [Scytonema sp. UIC 10036]|uniref:CARDB domain-containing protein n=1 Tax=Scytonema sp. UIC 10036 TaxID=2304196 RepID=UPI0012DA239E|nr:CARDB domain-containing protein [Scytonema sp. UIC 10036]MUH00351.1 hypothetical protein [Scytonema sp. UIC 10036]